jgi:hypothetical protein
LGKRQEHVEGQSAHRRRGVELLGYRDEGNAVSIDPIPGPAPSPADRLK